MISLFEKDATTFDGNGICTLAPTVCTVSETAGGSYLLHMKHPLDEEGKWLMLTDERIIKAPVPPFHMQAFTLPDCYELQTNDSANLYSVLPSYKRISEPEDVKKVRQNPQNYLWASFIEYKTYALVVFAPNQKIYRALAQNRGVTPGSSDATLVWQYVSDLSSSGDRSRQDPGQFVTLAAGITVYKIADYNGTYMQVRVGAGQGEHSGEVGYIERVLLDDEETEMSGMTIPQKDITEQAFRIYSIEGDDDNQSIIVDAKHISYDFQGNALYSCNVTGADPMTAIAIIQGSLLDADNRLIVTNISGTTVSKDWSFLNPINALLDPDAGLVPQLGAQLIRDNRDFYILSNDHPRQGIRLAYGHNLLGVHWNRSTENVITRVLPRCGDGQGGNLYLDDVYVESDISTAYAYQRTEMMNCGYAVGDTYDLPDGTTVVLDAAAAKLQMEKDARERFDVDKADAAEVGLEVNFILIGDTEEYKQYKGMQTVCLYDEITVEMYKTGMRATAQVIEYEYDCILKRYNNIRTGNIRSMQRRIPGYRMKNGAITYDKLGHDVITRIRNA